MHDLVIRGGAVVLPDGVQSLDIAVDDGRIVALEPGLADGRETVDAAGLHVLPGMIDPHVHLNEPGRTEWEGFATGSLAFASGGGTTLIDMPLNSTPPTVDAAAFAAKRAAGERSSRVDFALWGGLVPGNLDRLDELAAAGAIGFKAFLSNSGMADFSAADDVTLYDGMIRAAALGLPVAVHAEHDGLTAELARRAIAAGRTGVRDYLGSRPVVAELEAIDRVITFAQATGCALHIVHVSTGAGIARVAAAKARGVDVTAETCPHYLVLTDDNVAELGAVAKCAPPIRDRTTQAELWTRLLAGEVDWVASDHSPSPPELKTSADFFAVWGGISSIGQTLSLMLTEGVARRDLPLEKLTDLLAGAAARRFWLPRKGHLAPGFDADLALVDLSAESTLTVDDLRHRHRQSPYLGRKLRGRVVRTILGGRTIWSGGNPVGEPFGRFIAGPAAG